MTTTNHEGSFFVVWMPSATGEYVVRATWKGDEIYPGTENCVNLVVIPTVEEYLFCLSSNSTISNSTFNSNIKELSFTVDGPSNTTGYTYVSIAKALTSSVWSSQVYIDGKEISFQASSTEDSWYIHFSYDHRVHQIRISLDTAPDIIPPKIKDIRLQPTTEEDVIITSRVSDEKSGVKEVSLHYSTNGGVDWKTVPMNYERNTTYMVSILKQQLGLNLQYYVEAIDNALNKVESSMRYYSVPKPFIETPIGIATIGIVTFFIVVGSMMFFMKQTKPNT
jgi:hypothetical protein